MNKKQNKTAQLAVRISPDERALIQQAAKSDGKRCVSRWIRETLASAAKRVLRKNH